MGPTQSTLNLIKNKTN